MIGPRNPHLGGEIADPAAPPQLSFGVSQPPDLHKTRMPSPDRTEVIGLSIAAAAVLAALWIAWPQGAPPTRHQVRACALPDVRGTPYERADNAAVFTLPDTGGFDVNGQAWTAAQVRRNVSEILAPRPRDVKAVFVHRPPVSRCADLRLIDSLARAAGGRAFDAASVFGPREVP